jgi:hypothetical protein
VTPAVNNPVVETIATVVMGGFGQLPFNAVVFIRRRPHL